MAAGGRLRTAVALVALLALAAALRLGRIGADPPLSLSYSMSEVMDGPWYLAEAADGLRGQPLDVLPQYRKPLFTALATLAFRAGGVSLEAAHALAALAGILLVAATAAAAREAYGARAGWIALVLAAASFPLVGYSRTPLVYGPLAALLAIAAALFAAGLQRRSRVCLALAYATVAVAALGLKQSAVVILPAFLAAHAAAAERPRRAIAIGLAAGGLAALAGAIAAPGAAADALTKLGLYLDLPYGNPVEVALAVPARIIDAPRRSGLTLVALPLVALAWLGALVAIAGRRPVDVFLAAWLTITVAGLGALRFIDPPLRHFVAAVVPAVVLAAGLLSRAAGEGRLRLPRPRILGAWAFPAIYGALSVLAYAAVEALRPEPTSPVLALVSFPAFAIAAAAAAAALARVAPEELRVPPRAAAAALAIVLASDAYFLVPALGRPTYLLREANRRVAALLPPGAAICGSFAHALTYDAPAVRRGQGIEVRAGDVESLLEPHRRGYGYLATDYTHIDFVEQVYAQAGMPLEKLAELDVRGCPVRVYRYAWTDAPR